jgi:hypothetical protein
MPLDPSIIANSMTNITSAMPDVSNLMAQRAQGMENIYKIERQREADAQAAAQAQAEELTAALSPAIAAAFTDPSDEGLSAALGMVPEQYRGAAQAQLDQLRSIGDLNQRKNIMRAALVQDDVGQRLLAQLEPTANMRLQADTAASAQALQRRRLEMEEEAAARGPAPRFEIRETDIGFVRVNPQTGEVFPIEAPNAAAGIPGPRVAAETTPDITAPIGTQQPPKERVLQPKAKGGGEITQAERRAAALLDNVVRNAATVNQTIAETPDAFQPTAVEAASGFLPWGERQAAAWQQTPERKIVYNRMLQSIDALLTLATGAAYTKPQLEAQLGAYLPGFFDEDIVKRDKVLALRDRIESEKINAGRAWTPEQEAKAEEVFRQFETLAEVMSGGEGAPRGGGEIDTSNPLLQD